MGVANKWSIAWGIAKKLHEEGANLIFSYYGESSLRNLEKLLDQEGIQGALTLEVDVTRDDQLEAAFATLGDKISVLHGLVHSIAHAKKEELTGEFVNTSRDGFAMAQDISAYSLVAATRHAMPLMTEGGSVIALTYLGGERVVKNYNVMGVAKASLEASVKYLAHDLGAKNIRVNAISAGPIKTLAAKGIGEIDKLLKAFEEKSPMHRGVTQEEIGNSALFLISSMSSAITGEVLHVDCGYSILGY
jgi:enoyl-[acyl-carrier protein] reductase I